MPHPINRPLNPMHFRPSPLISLFTAFFTAVFTAVICSGSLTAASTLDTHAQQVRKFEVSQSMTGYRETLRFYIFNESKAILVAKIDNKNTEFPISAKLYQFAQNTTADALDKWVNNQHSDGLYADAPKPVSSHEIPVSSCLVKSHQLIQQVKALTGKFNRYKVTFEIKDIAPTEDIAIKGFTDTANIYVGPLPE